MDQQTSREILEKQPGLLSVDFEDLSDSSSEVLVQSCTERVDSESDPKASSSVDAEHESIVEQEQAKGALFEIEDLEQLMSEIGNVRENLRLMPDFQRREMAAALAMRMATMFGDDNSGDEDGFE